jgi:hypothetical protein
VDSLSLVASGSADPKPSEKAGNPLSSFLFPILSLKDNDAENHR